VLIAEGIQYALMSLSLKQWHTGTWAKESILRTGIFVNIRNILLDGPYPLEIRKPLCSGRFSGLLNIYF
jgi:hypothetical protein